MTTLTISFGGVFLSLWRSESKEGHRVTVISLGEVQNGVVMAGGEELWERLASVHSSLCWAQ